MNDADTASDCSASLWSDARCPPCATQSASASLYDLGVKQIASDPPPNAATRRHEGHEGPSSQTPVQLLSVRSQTSVAEGFTAGSLSSQSCPHPGEPSLSLSMAAGSAHTSRSVTSFGRFLRYSM